MCRSESKLFCNFSTLKRHIIKVHPTALNTKTNLHDANDYVPHVSETDDDSKSDPSMADIRNPFFSMASISLQEVSDKVCFEITNLRSDTKVTESTIQSFMKIGETIVACVQQYEMSLIKSFLQSKNISCKEEMTKDFIDSLYIPSFFSDIKTIKENLRFLSLKAKCAVPTPMETKLGTRKIIKTIPLNLRKGARICRRVTGDFNSFGLTLSLFV